MYLDRNRKDSKLSLIDNDKEVLSMSYFFDEFIWFINSIGPIEITREVDETLYNNLCNLFENQYEFYISDNLTSKKDNKIIWFSDQMVDLDNLEDTDRVTRLVIERKEDKIVINVINPFFNRMGIVKQSYTIAFSPGGNGYMTRNVNTGKTFQDDIVCLFMNTMDGISIGEEQYTLKQRRHYEDS